MAPASQPRASNDEIADALERVADLLEAQGGEPFRARAYRGAASTLRGLERPAVEILAAEGTAGLLALPGIGKSIAALVDEYAHNLRLGLLDRLEGQTSPEDLFTTLPGVGDALAERIHRELGVETLEALEVAAHDGRLARVPGIGPRRVRAIQDSLAVVLAKSSRRRARRHRWLESDRRHPEPPPHEPGAAHAHAKDEQPPVALLLEVDAEYRRRAEAGELRTIAPRRFNPGGRAWLPVLHTERDGWAFTALFSNTARAHELGRTRDWVVVYWEQDGHEDQCTIVTERTGPLAGWRVVRGREPECAALRSRAEDAP
ncbi:MAG TPA: helix-hairpin-helix domain-containing protein [Myxococcota bacterium]|nr:helix-hairpin-helix domain-containing protein [Myxococcota bacterium]